MELIPTMLPPCPVFDEVLSFKQRMSDSLRSLDALRQPKTHRLRLAFLGQSGKVTKEAPQGTDGSLTSYALRARMHSTSQKSIAFGSYFWGVMDPCTGRFR